MHITNIFPFAKIILLLTVSTTITYTHAASAADWRSRTIYQLLTDRFYGSANTPTCNNLGSYCGGTFSGIVSKLDYIQGMGFDAIWISPVVDNTDGGYHGYWARNINKINSNFGTASDLELLISECHKRDIWVMVDVVGNHMGYGAPSAEFAPLADPSSYHNCDSCPQYCNIDDFTNQNQVELCRLVGLPDLNQSNPIVSKILTTWIHQLVANYSFDGIRIDTVCEVNKQFWGGFKKASGVYSVGEVNNGDVGYVSSYQSTSPGTNAPGVDGTLSYPLYYSILNVFAKGQSFRQIHDMLGNYQTSFHDVTILGTFIDNHDNPRFLSIQQDRKMYEAAITFVLMTQGIPIVYYGTEQWLEGTQDPANRAPLWNYGFNTQTEMYVLIQTILKYRAKMKLWQENQVERYLDDEFLAFTRGDALVLVTNQGSNKNIQRTITYHPYAAGTKICNIFYADNSDCITIGSGSSSSDTVKRIGRLGEKSNNKNENENGISFGIYLAKGESKIYVPV